MEKLYVLIMINQDGKPMIKSINTIRTELGTKILKTPCVPVETLTNDHVELIRDLIETAQQYPGCIGLSANQIWESPDIPAPAIFVLPGENGWAACINPTIEKQWKKTKKIDEGCMSVPGIAYSIERARHIKVSYYDSTNTYQQNIHLFDMAARVFQHELDHIQGRLISDN